MAKRWIQSMDMKKGAFRAKAKAAGKSTAEFAEEHAGDSGKIGKEARLAQTFAKMRSGMASGGTVRGGGAAIRGLKFLGE